MAAFGVEQIVAERVDAYLFTALNPNKIGPSNKGLDKSPRFV